VRQETAARDRLAKWRQIGVNLGPTDSRGGPHATGSSSPMTINAEFKKVYPDLNPDEAIVGEDGPYPFCGGELTEVWFEQGEEYNTCFFLSHPTHGTKVLRDFEQLCAFVSGSMGRA
jgi:hypothetical protein